MAREMLQVHGLELQLLLTSFDLREIEHLIDQRQQIATRRVNGLAVVDLLLTQVAGLVLRQEVREQQHAVQRSAQLVRHVGQELRLVGAHLGELLGLLLQAFACFLQLGVLLTEDAALGLQLGVGHAQLFVLTLQLLVVRAQLFFLRAQALRLALAALQCLAQRAPRAGGLEANHQHLLHRAKQLAELVRSGLEQG